MKETDANELSPQFKYIEEQKYKTLMDYVDHTIKTLDDCILSVFHRKEDDDRVAFGEIVALRNVRNILIDNRKYCISKLEDNKTSAELEITLNHYLRDFDQSKIEVEDWERNGCGFTEPESFVLENNEP